MTNNIKVPIPATLILGDGIGPEVANATVSVLETLGAPFAWETRTAGMASIEQLGDVLPEKTLESIRRTGLALKGPLTTPVGGGFRSVNIRLREELMLYANVRPSRTIVPGRYENIDIVMVRENIEGFHVAHENYLQVGDDPRAVGVATGMNTREGSRRIARFAFEYAVKNGRKKITIVHKANVLKILTGIFLDAVREVAREYQGRVEVDERIVEACAMQLLLNPWQFDMFLTTDLFGDVLAAELAGLVGGPGMAPASNIGAKVAIFEAAHGSAPDIAGHGTANPAALILAAGLMLDHVGQTELAARLRQAIDQTLNQDKVRTADLGGKASTQEFTDALKRRLA